MGGKFFDTLQPADYLYSTLIFDLEFEWIQDSRLEFIFLQDVGGIVPLPSSFWCIESPRQF